MYIYNMKKFIFIDNDNLKSALEDVDDVKNNLILYAKIPAEIVDNIEIISDFHTLEKDKKYELLFSNKNIICSWSMYTASHYGSLYQLTTLLKAASANEIKNIVYVDGSGELPKSLENELKIDTKNVLHILNAIETNYIISFDLEDEELTCYRLRINLKGFFESPFKKEKINLLELIK